MKRLSRLPILMLMLALPALPGAAQDVAAPQLRFVEVLRIADKSENFDEPSGVALSLDASRLWAVSDDARRVFVLGLDGRVLPEESFPISERGLEGIAVHPSGQHVLAVKEETSEVLVIDIRQGEIAARVALEQMRDFERIAADFPAKRSNRGLEGITIDPASGGVFVVKQARPKLLIEISPDLQRITGARVLTARAGFVDDNREERRIDASGLAFDPSRNKLWIVSDTARRVYLYDWERDRAVSAPLVWHDGFRRRTVEHAEGVAVDRFGEWLYVVTDDKRSSRLFVFRIE